MECDEKLIELVRRNALIYDKREALFKNKQARRSVWCAIGTSVGMTGEECEQRWGVLRTRYNTELRNLKRPPEPGCPYKRKWPLFDEMRFLDTHIVKKRSKQYYPRHDMSQQQEQSMAFTPDLFLSEAEKTSAFRPNDSAFKPNEADHFTYEEMKMENIPIKIEDSSSESFPAEPERSPSEINTTTIEPAFDTISSYFKTKNESNSAENADMCFAKQIYFYLNDVKSEKKKKKIKRDILNIFINADEDSN